MKADSKRWHVIARTPHAHEQLGLDLIRESLPDQSPYEGWVNFEFMADNGQLYEVDALILTPKGFFLVELKHWEGNISGDPYTWEREVDGRRWNEDSPFPATNRKAKYFKSLLQQTAGRNRGKQVPWVHPLVVLSNNRQRVRLTPPARHGVAGPDRSEMVTKDGLDAVAEVLTSLDAGVAGERVRMLPPQVLADASRLVTNAGIKPRVASRRVGDFELVEDIEAGDVYQDYRAHHHRTKAQQRRVRIYTFAQADTEADRQRNTRLADREFELFAGVEHPGIDAPLNRVDHERGPCLVFNFDPEAARLDHWLRRHDDELTIAQRLAVVRQVAEALAFAHERHIFHRALDPHAVWVAGSPDDPRVKIRNWHAAVRAQVDDDGRTRLPTMLTGVASGLDVATDVARRYQAPELRMDPRAMPRLCDIFSLGAITFLVLSGTEPAQSVGQLDDQLLIAGGLLLDNVIDGVNDALTQLVWFATNKDPQDRYASVSDFLKQLDEAESAARVTAPERPDGVHPLEAVKGDVIADRFVVEAVLGTGATAKVLLVADADAGEAERVLKIALDEERAQRLREEAAALQRLTHPNIVRLLADPLTIDGCTALLMARAGDRTLSDRLYHDGPPGLELLERWGEDLLQAVAFLETQGIAHRDIKPANIGVARQGRNSELHLVLFDFSLTKVPADRIDVGTTGYVDPFLRAEGRRRWDSHAERFAAAVTLYQLATGELPVWGSAGTDPLMTDGEVTIDVARFDPALAERLGEFFRTALARDIRDRYGSADEMLAAWKRCFANAAPTAALDERAVDLSAATSVTPISELGMSSRAVHALERAGLVTAGDLAAFDPMSLNHMRGVGKKTVAEIRDVQQALEAHIAVTPVEAATGSGAVATDALASARPAPVPLVAHELTSVASSNRAARIAELHLGLERPPGAPVLPTQTEIAERVHTTQATVSRALAKFRTEWARLPALHAIRDEIAAALDERGVMGAGQLAELLLVRHGSTADEPDRSRQAEAVVRAAVDIEADGVDPRWITRRLQDRLLLAATHGPDDVDLTVHASPEELFAWAAKLGELADSMVEREPTLTPERVRDALRDVDPPAGAPALDDRSLLDLAVAASARAARSARGELYQRGLPAKLAIQRAVGSLLGTARLTPNELATRLRARFPEMAPVPTDPAVVSMMLDEAGLSFVWDKDAGAWIAPNQRPTATASVASTVLGQGPSIDDFDRRLHQSYDSGRLLVLTCRPNRYLRALHRLQQFDVTVIDVDDRLLHHLRQLADELEIDWGTVLAADTAPPTSSDWRNLRQLADRAMQRLLDEIVTIDGTALLCNLGLLRRYGHLRLLDQLRAAVQHRRGSLRAVWALVATDTPDVASIDGEPIAQIDPAERARVPSQWLDTTFAA